MENHTGAYFDFRTTSRVTLASVIGLAMILSTCAYSWRTDVEEKQIKAQQAADYRKDMYDHGYQEVLKPCVPDGSMIWEKKP